MSIAKNIGICVLVIVIIFILMPTTIYSFPDDGVFSFGGLIFTPEIPRKKSRILSNFIAAVIMGIIVTIITISAADKEIEEKPIYVKKCPDDDK